MKALYGLALLLLIASAVHPHDYFTWFLEIAPILIATPILLVTRKKFPLTKLAYILIAIHMMILIIGGHYTYAEVPLFNWLRDHFGLARNYYDRVGHFAQGFVPAILTREILIRTSTLKRGKWLSVIVTAICLSISAIYELIEWQTAVWTGSAADAFLGTQGDPWDTQWDMFLALVGAITAQLTLACLQDQQMEGRMK
jgi:putative membrane protein